MVETRKLLKLAKKIAGKNVHKRLKRISDKDELKEATQYTIISSLKEEYQNMEIEIKRLEHQMKDVFFARNKLLRIPSKIRYFQINFDENEFDKLARLFESVRREIENV